MKKPFTLIIVFFFLICTGSQAGVNLKNGNFYVSYTDIRFANSGFGMEISRTYNSRIADIGWFGAGWGSEYETFLHTMPGGGAVVHWNGSGVRTFYKPAEWDMDEINRAVDQIVELEQAAGKVTSPDEILNLRSKLLNDIELRYAYWRKYLNSGKVREYDLKPNTRLYTYKGTLNKLVVTDSGYFNTGITDSTKYYFNKNGKLTRIVDAVGNFITLAYDAAGRIRFIQDSDYNKLTLTTNEKGRVLRMEDPDHRYAEYKYDDYQNLIYSKDTDGNQYWHGYDSNNNMTSISYEDGSRMEMEYNNKNYLIKLTDRKGITTEYEYRSNSNLDYGTLLTSRDSSGSISQKTLYWYTLKQNEVGATWMNNIMVVTNDTDTLMRLYNDRSILDSLIHNDTIWVYQNSVKGDLVKVTSNKGSWLVPEKRDEGIARITDPAGWLLFTYDKDEKPLAVQTSEGNSIPYPYPTDQPELQADISRIRTNIRILNYWQECSCFVGKWK